MRSGHKSLEKFILLALILAVALAPVTVSAKSHGLKEAVETLRDDMVARQPNVLVYLYSYKDLMQDDVVRDDVFFAACSEKYATDYNTGAYLKSNVKSCDVATTKLSDDPERWKISFSNIQYRTTAEQEAEFDAQLQEVMKELNVWDERDYVKCRAIYDYITSHVEYDQPAYQAHLLGDDSEYDLAYTAYSALIDGKAVCQGYATLFYAMCKLAGLDVLMVDGIAQGKDGWGDHAWNMVKVDGYWYQCDPTWDSDPTLMGYKYFLKGTDTFKKHRLDLEYTQNDFLSDHIMPVNSYKNSVNENPVIRLVKRVKELLLGK